MSDSPQSPDQETPGRFSRACAGVVVLVWLISFPAVLYHADLAWQASSNRVEDWIPSGHPQTRELDRFNSLFNREEVLVLSWPGCTLDDSRLARLRHWAGPRSPGEQTGHHESFGSGGKAGARLRRYFQEIVTAQDLFKVFEQWPRGELSERHKRARLRGWLLGPDGRTTLAIAVVSEAGIRDRQAAVDAIRAAAVQATGLPLEQVHMAGSTIESVATDEANRRSLQRLGILSFVICGGVLLIAFRNVPISLLVLGIAVFNQQLALAMVAWTGGRIDAVLMLMASVIFVLSISAGCHFLRYLREALIETGPAAGPLEALRRAFRPALLAALTSAIGFASLATSLVIPVQNFGKYSALMVLISGITVPLLIIASATLLPPRKWYGRLIARQKSARPADQPVRYGGIARLAARWPWVIGLSLLVLLATSLGLPRLRTALGIFQMFSDDAKVLVDHRWLEENVGPLAPIEVTLSAPKPAASADAPEHEAWLEELRAVREVALALQQIGPIEAVVSPLNFIPSPPFQGSGIRHVMAERAFASSIQQSTRVLTETGFFRAAPDARHWRISARVRSSSDPNYAALNRAVESAVAAAIGGDEISAAMTHQVSGSGLVFERMQRQLLRDMATSFLTAVGLIALMMSAILRSVFAGVASMLPNLIPAGLLFGSMAWLGIPIEIGSVLTASVGVGVAVDDSLHLIYAFTRSPAQSNSGAILDALQHSGPAMIQTTAVCCFGMLVFALSSFLPITRFAWVIATLLGIALAGDLLVLPAILASPAGRRVRRTDR